MIRLSVMYPHSEGATFDMDYYCNSHIVRLRQLIGGSLKGLSVDRGISQPGSPAPFMAIGQFLFDSLAELQSALAAHGPTLVADIPNFTNAQPAIQVSEIKLSE